MQASSRLDKHLGGGFCCRIWVGRLQRRMLAARGVLAVARFAVHFVRADVDEALDGATQSCGLEQRVRAVYVVLREREAVAEAVVNVRLERAPERQARTAQLNAAQPFRDMPAQRS
jgi:hypothetical protein